MRPKSNVNFLSRFLLRKRSTDIKWVKGYGKGEKKANKSLKETKKNESNKLKSVFFCVLGNYVFLIINMSIIQI